MSDTKESIKPVASYINQAIVRVNKVIYNQEANYVNYGTTCFIGKPDSQRSQKLGELLMSYYLASSEENLPIITLMHGGCESADFIDEIIDELPASKKDLVANKVIRNTIDSAINPFDTHIGFRAPTSLQYFAMSEFLQRVLAPRGEQIGRGVFKDVADYLLNQAFGIKQDVDTATNKPYIKGYYQELDEAVTALGILEDAETISAAKLCTILHLRGLDAPAVEREWLSVARDQAHKLAMPVLPDFLAAIDTCKSQEGFIEILKGQEKVLIPQMQQQIKLAIEINPCLSHPTKFDVSRFFIVGIDLSGVLKPNDAWSNALFFQAAHKISLDRITPIKEDMFCEGFGADFKPYYDERLQQMFKHKMAFAIDGLDIRDHTNLMLYTSREQKKHAVRYIIGVEGLMEMMGENYGTPLLIYVTRFNIFSKLSKDELDIFMEAAVYEQHLFTRSDFNCIDNERYIFYALSGPYTGDGFIDMMLCYKQRMSADDKSQLREALCSQ